MKRGEIYFYSTYGKDSVQSGLRPVIIVQNDIGNQHSPTVIVCSITSKKKVYNKTHVGINTNGGLYKPSWIMCEQIQTVSRYDLRHYVGIIEDTRILKELDEKLCISLGIQKELNNG